MDRKTYPSDVSDEEWAFVAPYLTLMSAEAPPQDYSLREVFNGLRWMIHAGAPWRMIPNDLPPSGECTNMAFAILMLKNFVHLMAHVL